MPSRESLWWNHGTWAKWQNLGSSKENFDFLSTNLYLKHMSLGMVNFVHRRQKHWISEKKHVSSDELVQTDRQTCQPHSFQTECFMKFILNSETFTVAHPLKLWRHYRFGQPCNIFTDHKSLKYFFTQAEFNMWEPRSLELRKDYDLNIQYHLGRPMWWLKVSVCRKACCECLLIEKEHGFLVPRHAKEYISSSLRISLHASSDFLLIERHQKREKLRWGTR